MTKTTAPGGTGSRVRARTERPPRCERPKVENGRPCKRAAGAGTDHAGQGPCSLHDDGSWQIIPFAENLVAQDAFLAAVRASQYAGIRELVEPLGYHRRDVAALLQSSKSFEADYVEARGYDADTIRNELRRRAWEEKSDRLLELEAKMRLPEGQALQRQRIDADVRVSAAPVIDVSKLTLQELETLRMLLAKARPDVEALEADQRPALELLAGGGEA